VSDSVANDNLGDGIVFAGPGVAIGNIVSSNTSCGIQAGTGVTAVHNTIPNNGQGVCGAGDGVGESVFLGTGAGSSNPIGCNVLNGVLNCPTHP
jgi:hypothetical protein